MAAMQIDQKELEKVAVKESQKGISAEQEIELMATLNAFQDWLVEKGIMQKASKIEGTFDFPYSSTDWVMKVDNEQKNRVSFNTQLLNDGNCSFDYYKSILVHEFFHLVVQKVPNKEDATTVKDDFGDQLMKLIDIEADFFTAMFFRDYLKFGLVNYLRLYFEGSKAFTDRRIRTIKLERFIGTLLSIVKMFTNPSLGKGENPTWDLYLPSISPIYTDESLHVLVVKKEHIYFDEIKANYNDFASIKLCYANIDTLTTKGYIKQLIDFSFKALNLGKVPLDISSEIKKL
jgi:hypothetical protein